MLISDQSVVFKLFVQTFSSLIESNDLVINCLFISDQSVMFPDGLLLAYVSSELMTTTGHRTIKIWSKLTNIKPKNHQFSGQTLMLFSKMSEQFSIVFIKPCNFTVIQNSFFLFYFIFRFPSLGQ